MKKFLNILLLLALTISCAPEEVFVGSIVVKIAPLNSGTVSQAKIYNTMYLTPLAVEHYKFKEWQIGNETIVPKTNDNTISVVLDAHKTVIAVFVKKDTDNDGVTDDRDQCPETPSGLPVDANGCADSQKDTDGDGVTDNIDLCPNTPEGEEVDPSGCADSEKDTDHDGVTDDLDLCPNTMHGYQVDYNGCADNQKDTDGDGVTDDIDLCPNTQSGEQVDQDGCADSQKDTDGDGVTDDIDQCPNTASGAQVGADGCALYQPDWYYNCYPVYDINNVYLYDDCYWEYYKPANNGKKGTILKKVKQLPVLNRPSKK